ncbi:hypothetical protein M758_UG220900 [Ceratodon purpureus]|nr:hypothetical protein M758_UG220900 [Ceratodon purpureus]
MPLLSCLVLLCPTGLTLDLYFLSTHPSVLILRPLTNLSLASIPLKNQMHLHPIVLL